jgi:hypothetical protein
VDNPKVCIGNMVDNDKALKWYSQNVGVSTNIILS